MTHMHGDHAGGLGQFAASEVLMSAAEAKLALGRSVLFMAHSSGDDRAPRFPDGPGYAAPRISRR